MKVLLRRNILHSLLTVFLLRSFFFSSRAQVVPLRTVMLDPNVNNFPRSKTRTELMKRIKLSAAPHPSYDLVRRTLYSTHCMFDWSVWWFCVWLLYVVLNHQPSKMLYHVHGDDFRIRHLSHDIKRCQLTFPHTFLVPRTTTDT